MSDLKRGNFLKDSGIWLVFMYLISIVLANLSITYFGLRFVVFNQVVLIGLDLTARDRLHDQWEHKHLWRKMLVLILSGGVISVVFNLNALPIAVASCSAFIAAGIGDTIAYNGLRKTSPLLRINGSNIVASLLDTFVFMALAFGFPLAWGILWQMFGAKLVGGFLWSLILVRRTRAVDDPQQS